MSSTSIYEGTNAIEKHLLDAYALPSNTVATRVALLTGVQERRTTGDKPFYKLVFKDKNGKVITGRLFNPEDSKKLGTVFKQMKNKVVRVEFTAEEFSGEEYLRVENVTLADEDLQELKSLFVGRVGDDELVDGLVDFVKSTLREDLPEYLGLVVETIEHNKLIERMKWESLTAYDEKLGSKLLHMSKMLNSLVNAGSDVHEIVQYVTVELHVKESDYKEDGIESDKLSKLIILDKLLTNVVKRMEDNGSFVAEIKAFKMQAIHLAQVRLGMAKPKTLTEFRVTELDRALTVIQELTEVHVGLTVDTSKATKYGQLYKERG